MVTSIKKPAIQIVKPQSEQLNILHKDLHRCLSQLTARYRAHQSETDSAGVKIKGIMTIVSTAIVHFFVDKDMKALQASTQKACALMTPENKNHPDLEIVHQINQILTG